jgi:hypothetical protein
MPPLGAKSLERLRKVWARRSSNHEGEARAAENRAEHIVKPYGYGLEDVPELLREAASKPTAALQPGWQRSAGFSFYNLYDLAQAAADEEKQRGKRSAAAAERADVIRRYGSLEKARSWQPNEQLLRSAVHQWSIRLGGKTQLIAGISVQDYAAGRSVPKTVLDALSAAYPLPATISVAAAEYEYWRTRRRDLELVADFEADEYLDFPCVLRWKLVEKLLENGLRATSISEILMRLRHPRNQGLGLYKAVEDALLQDLEHFDALEKAQYVQFGHVPSGRHDKFYRQTASERREHVKSLLSKVDAKQLSNREIARRTGVSPQTVGNIRRRI